MTLTLKNETLEDIKNNSKYPSLCGCDIVKCLTNEQSLRLAETILFEVRQRNLEKEEQMLEDLKKESAVTFNEQDYIDNSISNNEHKLEEHLKNNE